MNDSQWNKEIVIECFRCLRDQDMDRMVLYLHPEVAMEVPGASSGRPYAGPAAIRDFFNDFFVKIWRRLVDNVTSRTDTILAEGDAVFASTVQEGTTKTGERFQTRMGWLLTFDGRKIKRIELSWDTEMFHRLLDQLASATAEPAA